MEVVFIRMLVLGIFFPCVAGALFFLRGFVAFLFWMLGLLVGVAVLGMAHLPYSVVTFHEMSNEPLYGATNFWKEGSANILGSHQIDRALMTPFSVWVQGSVVHHDSVLRSPFSDTLCLGYYVKIRVRGGSTNFYTCSRNLGSFYIKDKYGLIMVLSDSKAGFFLRFHEGLRLSGTFDPNLDTMAAKFAKVHKFNWTSSRLPLEYVEYTYPLSWGCVAHGTLIGFYPRKRSEDSVLTQVYAGYQSPQVEPMLRVDPIPILAGFQCFGRRIPVYLSFRCTYVSTRYLSAFQEAFEANPFGLDVVPPEEEGRPNVLGRPTDNPSEKREIRCHQVFEQHLSRLRERHEVRQGLLRPFSGYPQELRD